MELEPKLIQNWKKHGALDLKKLINHKILYPKKSNRDSKKQVLGLIPFVLNKNCTDQFNVEFIFTGQLDSNLNGIGRLIFSDWIIEGQFLNGKLNGWARKIYDNGLCSIGWTKDGNLHGYGKRIYPDGKE